MLDVQRLRERATRCFQLAENLIADAETLKRFGEELAELARNSEANRLAPPGTELGDPAIPAAQIPA